MSIRAIKLIVSDLHVASGDTMLDGFGKRQQAALEGLLAAAGTSPIHGGASSPLGEADDVELIINGDCLDFQMVEPHGTGGVMDAGLALEKLRKVVAAHSPFFETLGRFARQPGRRVTFMTGNHDIELCFAEVRVGIMEAMGMRQDDERVYFCPTRSYRPLPDVYIEHGNAFDFWNHDRSGFWDASGHVRTANPRVITLPMDTQYVQHAGHPVLARYPYLTLFQPSLSIPRQVALFCLLNPPTVVQLIQHVQELLDAGTNGPRQRLLHLTPVEEHTPVTLFQQAIKVLMAFQREAAARLSGWKEPLGKKATLQGQARALMEVAMLRKTLSRVSENMDVTKVIATICTPAPAAADSVAAGIQTVLKSDPTLRYALAGHTHRVCIDPIKRGKVEQQVYLNTGSWLSRLALPAPEEVTPELVAWFREPDRGYIPLREVPPRFVFALLNATTGEPSSASLCIWEGGSSGQHRIIA
jgi:UDP-2,3-diacylglucosamine pyrophosphatase LpxH